MEHRNFPLTLLSLFQKPPARSWMLRALSLSHTENAVGFPCGASSEQFVAKERLCTGQADGRNDLERYEGDGDASDPFPGSRRNTSLTSTSTRYTPARQGHVRSFHPTQIKVIMEVPTHTRMHNALAPPSLPPSVNHPLSLHAFRTRLVGIKLEKEAATRLRDRKRLCLACFRKKSAGILAHVFRPSLRDTNSIISLIHTSERRLSNGCQGKI